MLVLGHKEQTALMFIGLPTALALLLAALPAAKSATGMIMKGITLFLLLLGILFIEGFICILMAAPFFYSIGALIGIFVDKARAETRVEQAVPDRGSSRSRADEHGGSDRIPLLPTG